MVGYVYKVNESVKRWFLIREKKLYCYKIIKDEDFDIILDLDGCEIKVGEEERSKFVIYIFRDGLI